MKTMISAMAILLCCLAVPAADATDTAEGRHLFRIYCTGCHGNAAKGDGPAAAELQSPPPDLTLLSKYNDGEFPREVVARKISGLEQSPGHSAGAMPLWSFNWMETGSDTDQRAVVEVRIRQLVRYLESVQNLK
jgi:mono/diheme cytochrome c family protein